MAGRFMQFMGRGGGTLIGSVLSMIQNRRFMNESYEREDTQLQRMVADAAAAGISPVAALGASGAYSQTANYQPQTTGSEIGEALSDVFGERSELENELLRAQIDSTRAESAAMLVEARSRTIGAQIQAGATATPPGFNENSQYIPGYVTEGPLKLFDPVTGEYTLFPGGMTPQQVYEDLYGGIIGEFYGIGNWFRANAVPMFRRSPIEEEKRAGYYYGIIDPDPPANPDTVFPQDQPVQGPEVPYWWTLPWNYYRL